MRQLLMSIFGWILTASNNILPLNRRPVVHAQQHREIRTAENTLYAALCVRNHAAYCIFCEWDTSP